MNQLASQNIQIFELYIQRSLEKMSQIILKDRKIRQSLTLIKHIKNKERPCYDFKAVCFLTLSRLYLYL